MGSSEASGPLPPPLPDAPDVPVVEPVGLPPTGVGVQALWQRMVGMLRHQGMRGVIARGAIWSFALAIAGTGLGFLVQFLLARALGIENYGLYSLVIGWTNLVLLLGKFEFDNAAVRFVGRYEAKHEWALLRGFLSRSRHIVALLSMGAGLVGAAFAWLWPAVSPVVRWSCLAAALLLPVTALMQLTASALQGFKRVVESQAPVLVVRPLLSALGVGAIVFVARVPLGPIGAVTLNLAASTITLLILAALLRRHTPAEAHAARAEFQTREWFRVALGMLWVSGAQFMLSQQTDIVVVGSILGKAAAGYYNAASQLSGLVQFGVNAFLFVATPMVSSLYAQGRRVELQRMVSYVGRMSLLFALPVTAIIALTGHMVLGWYGARFQAGYPVLLVLCVSQVMNAGLGALQGYLLTMTNHEYDAAWIVGASAVVYVVLALILTPRFGAVGTAIATLTSYSVRAIAMNVVIWRRLGINAVPFARLSAVTI